MKKSISLLVCMALLLCAVSVPTYATETEAVDNSVIDTIEYNEISPELFDLFEKQEVTVNSNSLVEVVEVVSGETVVNGLRVTNETLDGVERDSLFAIAATNNGARSNSENVGVVDIVSRNLTRGNTFPWQFDTDEGIIVNCTAYFDLYISNLDLPSYGVRPNKVTFKYSGTGSPSKILVRYGCAGHTYSYPGWTWIEGDGTYEKYITRTVNNPIKGTTYTSTGSIPSGKVIVPFLGDYYTRGHFISCQVTLNGSLIPGSISF